MDHMDKLTFSSPFCLLCPLGPKDASLRQKYAVKYKEQMPPLQFQKQRVLQFKNLSGCRKFQAQRRYEFLSQNVEEAIFCRLPSVAKAMEGILRPLRCTPLIFASKKKSTDGIPDGLPSVALAKDGGGRTNLTYDISTLTMVKDFQVWWWFYFREKFFQILDQAENFGRLFVFLKSAPLKFSTLEYG